MESISLRLCSAALFFLCSDCCKSKAGESDLARIYSRYPQLSVSKWWAFCLPCSEDKYWCVPSIYQLKFSSCCNQKESEYWGGWSGWGVSWSLWHIHEPSVFNTDHLMDLRYLGGFDLSILIHRKKRVLLSRCFPLFFLPYWFIHKPFGSNLGTSEFTAHPSSKSCFTFQ